jgi:hypothetical protein
VELCLFSSALPGWDPARVADSARAVGLTTVEWGVGPGQALESPLRAAHALRDLGVRAGGVCVQGGAASLTTRAGVLYDPGNMAIEGHVDPALDHLGGRPTLALLRREVDLLRALLPR